ncbi:MAG: response regulator [Desulfovibrio sp.]|nr:response regulator [Desulfovibrio sp.]MBI4959800.1 response regulator [Desulfovibrio sp.]
MKTVLVIDDEKPTLSMFCLLLEAMGYEVLTAESGAEGLELFESKRPKIVLTDIKMPDMDGLEVLSRIKALDAETQVIVVTGHGDVELALDSLSLDATGFIDKPIRQDVLQRELARARERLDSKGLAVEHVQVRRETGVLVVEVGGRLSAASETAFDAARDKAAELGQKVVVSLDESARLTGAGIALITQLLLACRDAGSLAVVAAATEEQRQLLQDAGVAHAGKIFPSEAEALASTAEQTV